jgi:hypothetical protein
MSVDAPSPPIASTQILQTVVSRHYELSIDDTALLGLLPACDPFTAVSVMALFAHYFRDHNDEMLTALRWQCFEPHAARDGAAFGQ